MISPTQGSPIHQPEGGFSMMKPEKLTIERLYDSPSLVGPTLSQLRFSPDGQRLTYLKGREEDYRQLDLWEFNLRDQEHRMLVDSRSLGVSEALSEEEKERRERARIHASGIVSYSWAQDGRHLIFPMGGQVFYYSLDSGRAEKLTSHWLEATDVKASPQGRYVSFIHDQNIWVCSTETKELKKLTSTLWESEKNGMAEFIAQEEMGRQTGYWWSEDDRYICYAAVDESPIEKTERFDVGGEGIRVITQRYPWAGKKNARVQLKLMHVGTEESVSIDLGPEEDIYLARVNWLPGGKQLVYQLQSRDQKKLDLYLYDVESGQKKLLFKEESDTWVNLHDDLLFLKKSPGFLWCSEESGYKHIYLHGADGERKRALTAGAWAVKSICGVDEERGVAFFTGFFTDPLEQHLYEVALDGIHEPVKLTDLSGWHDVRLSPKKDQFIDFFSDPSTPLQVSLKEVSGGRPVPLMENPLDETHPYYPYLAHHSAPEFGSVKAEDGTPLFWKLIKPSNFDPEKSYPVVVSVYGGPHARKVKKNWDPGDGWNQFMAQKGYAVFSLDNRGSCDRGKVFEEPIYKQLGKVEVADQKAGVEFLKTLSWVDPNRVGMFGWSYGGYMTIMSLLKEPETFRAGVAVAPVTDWKLYDTHYTERYLAHPDENPEGYEKSAVWPYVKNLKGSLFLIHGMADENVLYQHTLKLMQVLQEKNHSFREMGYPGSKHGIAKRSLRVHLFREITQFFDEKLQSLP